jgi:triphosphoribosyl-dephospho-CoA synthetase
MDYDMMNRSIDVLQSVFYELATMPQENGLPSHSDLLKIGLAGEEKMLKCTGGVNTHRGALFSLGLTVVAAASILADDEKPTVENLPVKIRELASRFQRIGSSHGMEVRQKYGIPGALDYALDGYEELFSSWLPYLRANEDDENKLYKLLLLIMSELDDTNVYYRAGKTGAKFVKDSAREILSSFYICKLSQLNDEYCRGNISPGGAADMLALTIFIDSITK